MPWDAVVALRFTFSSRRRASRRDLSDDTHAQDVNDAQAYGNPHAAATFALLSTLTPEHLQIEIHRQATQFETSGLHEAAAWLVPRK